MTTTTTRQPAKQVRLRKIGVVERHGKHALLEIVESDRKTAKAEYYLCEEFQPSWGTAAYRLEKFDGTVYDVLIDDSTGHHACDCKGHIQHGHKTRCKHVAGILALRRAGQLPVSQPATLRELGRDFIPGHDDESDCLNEDIFG